MRTIVVTGGTDGMGAALVRHHLAAGDRVVVIGRSNAKFEALLAEVADQAPTATSRAQFIPADLSLVGESLRAVDALRATHDRVDALVLAASFIRQRRLVTPEGHEASWSLFFLSKYVFVTGLADLLRAAAHPAIVNTAVPGASANAVDVGDLELVNSFSFRRSNAQQRRANELLGILATKQNPDLSYTTWGPGRLVRTSFAGEVGWGMKIAAATLGPLLGQRPDEAVRPIIRIVDAARPGRHAYRGSKQIPLTTSAEDEHDAARLDAAVKASL